ncbi:MAG: metalloprotease [Thermoplasmata archaeon]
MTGWSYTDGRWRPAVAARPVTTSSKEILHLTIAFLVMTVDLMLIAPFFGLFPNLAFGSAAYLLDFGLVGATVAFTGFLAHELAHKITAERLGYWAEFRMSPFGLLFSLVVAYVVGFLFAAPGATVVDGITDAQSGGETSIAGPLTNLVFGALFYASAIAVKLSVGATDLVPAILFISFFNGWIATFNLIPFGPLDGRKVYRWRPAIWGITIAVSVVFAILCYLAFFAGTPFPHL